MYPNQKHGQWKQGMTNITNLNEWKALQNHFEEIQDKHLNDLFAASPNRFNEFSLNVGDIFLDYSKNRITLKTLKLLINLAKQQNLENKIKKLFSGDPINTTENRPALHTALRNLQAKKLVINNKNILTDIKSTLDKMQKLSDKIRNKQWLGSTGKPITDIVNVGIGGSHLGPMTTCHALSDYADKKLRCHFVSNIDANHLYNIINKINPETTLVIISSKSFSTLETITNAKSILSFFKIKLNKFDINKHFTAVTSNQKAAKLFGINEDNIFKIENFVGGRYSIWSPIGLPLAILIGMENFKQFLSGAFLMDTHFQTAPFDKNMPVLMALLSVWYINFFKSSNHAIVNYSHNLQGLPSYLQQLEMESNGKLISLNGDSLDIMTSPVIFGEQGSNAQHSFHQLFHQGPHIIPIDFILEAPNDKKHQQHRKILVGSAISQAQALMRGKSYDEALHELLNTGFEDKDAKVLAHHKQIPGNRPSNMLIIKRLTPKALGSLLALYEHKTFVQGIIWGVNSFDQFGVELGKSLLQNILTKLDDDTSVTEADFDASTLGLVNHIKVLGETNENI